MFYDDNKWVKIAPILRCPQTGMPLEFINTGDRRYFKTINNDIFYKIENGILDFVVESHTKEYKINQEIGKAYDKSIFMYDDYMEDKKLHWRILKQILLGLNRNDTKILTELLHKFLLKIKYGYILEIPVGTGIFSLDEYVTFPYLEFVAIDYSRGMLEEARKRAKRLELKNIVLIRADAGRLPFKKNVFNAVITLNGIHSFHEKENAIRQMKNVLGYGQNIFGSIVVKGERWLTDVMTKLFYEPGKWFMPPHLSKDDFLEMLENNDLKVINTFNRKALMLFEVLNNAVESEKMELVGIKP